MISGLFPVLVSVNMDSIKVDLSSGKAWMRQWLSIAFAQQA